MSWHDRPWSLEKGFTNDERIAYIITNIHGDQIIVFGEGKNNQHMGKITELIVESINRCPQIIWERLVK